MSRGEGLAVALVFAAGLATTMFVAHAGGSASIAFDGAVRARHIPGITLTDDHNVPLRLDKPAHGAIVVQG